VRCFSPKTLTPALRNTAVVKNCLSGAETYRVLLYGYSDFFLSLVENHFPKLPFEICIRYDIRLVAYVERKASVNDQSLTRVKIKRFLCAVQGNLQDKESDS